ncbi:MAG: anion transporter [Planctomycetes bacterium]|nr:anion transporter [Planctomycetota bacterium]
MSAQVIAVIIIFCLTYLLIASRRLGFLPIGRPAGALLGAVLMVAIGWMTPEESYQAINDDTIVLLFATMLITAYLQRASFFEWIAAAILARCRTPWQLLAAVALSSGVLSALLVNDTVCIFMTPVVVSACRLSGLPMGPYLIALGTSANIGSAATLVGNPQNMIIGNLSKQGFSEFLLCSGPAAAVGLLLNLGLLWLYYHQSLPQGMRLSGAVSRDVHYGRLSFVALVTLSVIAGFFAGYNLGYTALAGAMVLVLAYREEPKEVYGQVDWPLLVFFCCLFIVMKGFAKTGLVEKMWNDLSPVMSLTRPVGIGLFTAFLTLGSNLLSNVPMVLLSGPYLHKLGYGNLGWVLLAFSTTIAGNLTILGSVANIIVAERAKKEYALGFVEYMKFGLVSTILVLLAGVPTIFLVYSSLVTGR